MEPGTGSTIMGYAGIGGNANVQLHSDPYFHAASIRQVTNYVKGTRCQVDINTGNNVPVVNAGNDYTIPKGTPFVLSGEANDADVDDELTYCWEQVDDNRGGSTFPSPTKTRGVAFRSYEATRNNKRYFPNLSIIKDGRTSWKWEALANVSRSYNFRLTVRDNKDNGGANNSDDTEITVNDMAGPFVVNYPNDENIAWNVGGSELINWDVAGTNENGVNTTHVDILLSTDGGNTYPIILAENVPNDGSQHIRVPNNIGDNNRVIIKGRNHIFFDISNHNFSIEAEVPCVAEVPQNLEVSNIEGTSVQLSWTDVESSVIRVSYKRLTALNYRVVRTTNDNIRLTELLPNTDYEVKIKSRCRGGGASVDSDFTNTIRFRTTDDYCSLESENDDSFISNFELGTISNSTGSSVYTNYNHISTNLRKGVENELRITPSKRSASTRYRYIVWIDYNRDGDFEDVNERVIRTDRIRDNNITERFTIPNNVNNGYAKMRVAMVEGNTGSCGTFFTGEVEDYAIQIVNDIVLPVITINGNEIIEIQAGNVYNDLGASALDNIDGDITAAIVTVNNVDTSVLGDYQVTYNVVDSSGNNAIEVIRTIKVINNIALNYCIPVNGGGEPISGNTYISNVKMNAINNSSINNGYSFFESVSTNVVKGINTEINLEIKTSLPMIPFFGFNYAIWIDYNKNRRFEANERVWQTDRLTNASSIKGNFTIPNNILIGETRMRVYMSNFENDACDDYLVGEVEDYVLNIIDRDNEIPIITLNENEVVEVEIGSVYNELGATAIDNVDGDITGEIVIVENVNTSVIGNYQITYNVVDSSGNNAVEVIRTVRVVDTEIPVITLNGNEVEEISHGEAYHELGAIAIDNVDGDLTGEIVVKGNVNTSIIGNYQITYNVEDNAGNKAVEVTRTVRVVDTEIPVITLNGNEVEEISHGEVYHELGATAIDNVDGDITGEIVIVENVNTSVIGNYQITYNVVDSSGNNAVEVTRTVRVVDTEIPVITLNGNEVEEISHGEAYHELGATAIDNVDGDITGEIVIVENVNTSVIGNYQITYNVVDSSGNNAVEVIRTVRVVDTEIPVITLNGNEVEEISHGEAYHELGATAIDNVDGDLTEEIVVKGNVNTSVIGNYQITYNVVDSSGNNAVEVTRTVRVVDTEIPVITLNGNEVEEISHGEAYHELGATAIDNVDGDLTGEIVVKGNVNTSVIGNYQITYNVVDSSGNNAVEATRTVRVVDAEIPVITLKGDKIVEISHGEAYHELGATAIDNIDGDLTGEIVVKGNVNTSVVGNYQITYNVEDNSGNKAIEVIRKIRVNSDKIFVYPNPVKGNYLQVIFPQKELNYYIYNLLGRKVGEGKLNKGDRIRLFKLINGIYLIKMVNGSRIKTIKIIKN